MSFPGDFLIPAVFCACCVVALVSPSGIHVKLEAFYR